MPGAGAYLPRDTAAYFAQGEPWMAWVGCIMLAAVVGFCLVTLYRILRTIKEYPDA